MWTPPKDTVQRKVLLPLLVLGLAATGLALYGNYVITRQMVEDQLRIRASMLASMTNYSVEVSMEPSELQRIVTSLGAESDVLDIVVVSGSPAHVIASTRGAWLGKPLASLPLAHVREDLEKILVSPERTYHFDNALNMFDYTAPLLLSRPTAMRAAAAMEQ